MQNSKPCWPQPEKLAKRSSLCPGNRHPRLNCQCVLRIQARNMKPVPNSFDEFASGGLYRGVGLQPMSALYKEHERHADNNGCRLHFRRPV